MKFLVVVAALAALASAPAHAHNVKIYGASLGGPNWEGFPVILQPDLVSAGTGEKLEIVEAPIYIHYERVTGGWIALNPPQLITTQSWWPQFQNWHFDTQVVDQTLSLAQHDPWLDVESHTCPEDTPSPLVGQRVLSLPEEDYTLHANGTLSVSIPYAGGIGSKTILKLLACPGTCEHSDGAIAWYIMVGWNHPGTFPNWQDVRVDVRPGDIVVADEIVENHLPGFSHFSTVRLPMLTVHWVSTDIAQTSFRSVDSSDLAHFFNCYGDPDCCTPPCALRWGFDSDSWNNDGVPTIGQGARSYHLNFSNTGPSALALDDADLSHFSNDLSKNCGEGGGGGGGGGELDAVTGIDAEDEAAAILTWFGIARTGETMYLPSGEAIPCYTVVDWNKARAAAENPFGYRGAAKANAAAPLAEKVRWGFFKSLYR